MDFHDFLKLFIAFLPFYGIFDVHGIAMVFLIIFLHQNPPYQFQSHVSICSICSKQLYTAFILSMQHLSEIFTFFPMSATISFSILVLQGLTICNKCRKHVCAAFINTIKVCVCVCVCVFVYVSVCTGACVCMCMCVHMCEIFTLFLLMPAKESHFNLWLYQKQQVG